MISIIICSRKADIPQELKDNIAATIGCDYELCVIDNSRNEYNIFTAYNEGVRFAKGEILCFMHEDILFHSSQWGQIVSDFFSTNLDAGLLGVVGGQFVPDTPSSYWEGGATVGQIIQCNASSQKLIGKKAPSAYCEVVAVDGLWMCIPAQLFRENKLKWDADTFHGFHCYDMDICYQVIKNSKKVIVVRDILIEHQSQGNTDVVYCEQNQQLYEKWIDSFPIVRGRKMSPIEVEERTKMVMYIRGNLLLANRIQAQYDQLRLSKAYRIGNILLKPFKWLKRNK